MATDRCPYCKRVTVIKILQKNVETLSSVQCSECSRSFQSALDEGEETTLQKSAVTLEMDSAGALTTTALDELLANWDTRLANVVKNAAPHPIAKQRAYDEELLRMVKELRTLQNTSAAIQAGMPIREVSAEMAAKSDGEKSTLDLIKEAQRNNKFGTGGALGFSH